MSGRVRDASGLSGAILAGGGSVRLGTDKRRLTLGGAPLLVRTATTLRALVDDLVVVVAHEADRAPVVDLLGEEVEIALDAHPGIGPVAGLESALVTARHELVLVVATDHPELSIDVLTLLVARARSSMAAAVALDGPHGAEPFLAVYHRDALATVRARVEAGARRMQDALAALDPELVAEDEWRALDPGGRTALDVDVPDNLARFS